MVPAVLAVAFAMAGAAPKPAAATAAPAPAPEAEKAKEAKNLGELSLEELMSVQVTVASRKEEDVSKVAAAVWSLSYEDIRRSGATSIPEALRWVPGLFVGRGESLFWIVGSRSLLGFPGQNTGFLALSDGRILNSPLFGGVFWNVVQMPLEELARIEVIRGPGSSTWGANAVTGVINLVSKSADETQGAYASVILGNEDRQVYLRYGGKVGDLSYRLMASGLDRPGILEFPEGSGNSPDDWRAGGAGFRADWEPTDDDTVTAIGSYYVSREGASDRIPIFTPPFTADLVGDALYHGGSILGRWTHAYDDATDLTLQAYFDRRLRTREFDPPVVSEYTFNIIDLEARLRFPVAPRNDLLVGGQVHVIDGTMSDGQLLAFFPPSRVTAEFSAFFEDQLTVVEDRFKLHVGARVESNSFSGFEFQPTLRGAWTPSDRHTVWAGLSRAVRVPTLLEENIRVNTAIMPPDTVLVVLGNPEFHPEELRSLDVGYRVRPIEKLYLDLVGYVQDYRDVFTTEPGMPIPDPEHPGFTRIPLLITNNMDGTFYGAELSARAKLGPSWMQLGYTQWRGELELQEGSMDTMALDRAKLIPQNQLFVRWDIDIRKGLQADILARFVGERPSLDVEGYADLSLRVSWNPWSELWLTAVGQNLLHDEHVETASEGTNQLSSVPRAFYGQIEWRPAVTSAKRTTQPQ